MKCENFDLFPTLLKSYKNPNHDIDKKIIIDYKHSNPSYKNSFSDNLIHWGCNGSSVSVLEEKSLYTMKQWVKNCCVDFIRTCGYDLQSDLVVTDSWINECNSGGSQEFHFHSNSFISGTYYVNYDKDLHAPLQFKRYSIDSSQRQSISLERKFNTPYATDAAIFPEEGELFLWESHMTHGYDYNKEDGRISLSMNFIPEILSTGIYKFRVSRL